MVSFQLTKLLFTLFLLTLCLTSWGQKCGQYNIGGYEMRELLNGLKSLDEYEIDSDFASELGRELASIDCAYGDKRILTHYGMYSSECKKCAYAEFGFTVIDFGPDCLIYTPVEEFMNAYNTSMHTMITEKEQLQITNLQKTEPDWRAYISSFTRNANIQQVSDSFFHFTFSTDSLVSLLGQDAELLTVSILSIQDSASFSGSLAQVAETGFRLEFQPETFYIDELLIVFDLSAVTNKYDLCLCESSTMTYRTRFRFRVK